MKLVMATLLLLATPAYGLDARDTMQNWKQAPVEVRAQLLRSVLSERGEVGIISRDFIMSCMNRVAETRLLLPKRVVDMIDYCIKGDDEAEYLH
jgi:hypothetical protein